MKTRARRAGDGYVLNGTKLWITNGSIADVAVVWAKEDDGEIHGFLVERGTPGLLDARHPRQVLAARLDHLASWPSRTCTIPSRTCCPA